MANYYVYPGLKGHWKLHILGNLPSALIISVVCNYYKTPFEKITTKNRKREIVEQRRMAMYLIKKYTRLTLVSIGKLFNQDHTTVVHALRTMDDLLSYDDQLRNQIQEIISRI